MLAKLKLKDLILIENEEIALGPGLNIFTGETGAGKSAILTAIRLIAGERAEVEWIRNGSNLASVEAQLFSYSADLLAGIDPPLPEQPLTIRRELHRSGKSRCFIEDHLVSVGYLKEFMRKEIEMIDQNSASLLFCEDKQRHILDAFFGLEQESAALSEHFKQTSVLKQQLDLLLSSQKTENRDLDWAETCLKTIEEANLQQDEEEMLNKDHAFLSHAQELIEKVGAAAENLSDLVLHLKRSSYQLDSVARLDDRLLPICQTMKMTSLELEEAERFLRSYLSNIDADPSRLAAIERRMHEIEKLKRRFGPSFDEIQKKKAEYQATIDKLSSLNQELALMQEKTKHCETLTLTHAAVLSEKRKECAHLFSQAVVNELKDLNLPHAKFEVEIRLKPLSASGIDQIQFLFSANPGSALLPIEECASGGELSRLLFSAKAALAKKESVQCLIFDEIDSNVGGQTAAILGEKLKKIAQERQVICVTHFVQVARFALHHFVVSKDEKEGRATTRVSRIIDEAREREYSRMIGEI